MSRYEQYKGTYKQMQVFNGVKAAVQDLKAELKLRNESQVIAYLVALREGQRDKITLTQHQAALERADDIINQGTL